MPNPVWLAATTGQPPRAAQVNQFFGPHTSQTLYTATLQANQIVAGATTTNTNGLYLAQSFATTGAQTTVGYVSAPISTTTTSGTNLVPTTLGLFANSAGAPSGTAIVSTTITAEYANLSTGGVNTVFTLIPLPATGLTAATTYWLVLASAGNVSNNYTWFRSNQVSGASTSPNGTAWTAQAYGFEFEVFDQTVSGQRTATWEDSGARWTVSKYNTVNELSSYGEYTVGQSVSGYLQSFRNISYTSNLMTGVA